jgi:cell wall-associated NlpC family hydrolase
MKRIYAFFICATTLIGISPTWGAPTVAAAQKEVDRLRLEAAAIYESANEATLKIAALERETQNLKQQEKSLKSELSIANKVLAKIAIQNYQGSGFGNGLELLLSANPTKYLSDAALLEIIGNRYASEIRRYSLAKQKVQSSQLVIADRTALVKAERAKLNREVTAAKAALDKATKILNSLKKEDRDRLLKEEAARENKILQDSQKIASTYKGDNSRGSLALKFALQQIGDIYVWAAAGPTKWDCSGLTMRAYQSAGVALPHSSRIQIRYGKSVSYSSLRPGDLLFFGKPISHVSIYMGGGKMVQAPRPGKRVEVVPLTRMFGSKPFVGARRL